MNKITKFLYRYFKKKYLRQVDNIDEVFYNALSEVYNNPFMLHIWGIENSQIQLNATSMTMITIYTERPGLIIGKGGEDIGKLEEVLMTYLDTAVSIDIKEIKK